MPNQTILIIDYEPRSIERFRQPLTDAGYTVEVATDGLTGIEAFHRLTPDMVLVEAMIPKKHGFEVCQELKRTPHGKRTPVIITTGVYKGRKYRTQALHIYGCDEYIEKPIAPEQLLAVVGKFFGPASASASSAAPEARTAPPVEPAVIAVVEGAMRASVPVPVTRESPAARPSPPQPKVGSVAKDFTEEEIMARLDAILPGGDFTSSPGDIQASPIAIATTPEPMAAAPAAGYGTMDTEQDPFANMQAELTAELGSISAALALEPAPVFDPTPHASYSDQALAPSVLEALPVPEIETPPVPEPEVTADFPALESEAPATEQPGQLVNFDAKRSRRKKNFKKSQAAPNPTPSPAPAPAPSAIGAPATEAPVAKSATARAEALSLPTGTLVESDLAEGSPKKSVPVWVWAALAVIALVAVYFTLLRGERAATQVSQAKPAEVGAATSEPIVADSIASQGATDRSNNASLVLNSVAAVPRRGAADAEASTPAPAAKKSVAGEPPQVSEIQENTGLPGIREWAKPGTPEPSSPGTDTTAPSHASPGGDEQKPSEELLVPPVGSNDDVTGVESIAVDPAPTSTASIAPGTLVDSEEVDTAPVSLSRKAPLYSLQARQMRLQGTVVMKVLVNERGTVDEVVLVDGVPGGDLNASAMRAAKSWTYRPATKGGVPVKVWKVEQVAFKL